MVEISAVEEHPGIFIVTDNLRFPYNIKFHFIKLFHLLMKRHIKRITRSIPSKIDVVWSFDLAYVYPLKYFPKSALKIFHPVDDPLLDVNIQVANGAQILFSTAEEILAKYRDFNIPKYFINHGLAESFLQLNDVKTDQQIHVGFAGNLLREDIDRVTFLNIIEENRNVVFECWGACQLKEGNFDGFEDEKTKEFISRLKKSANVVLHGVVTASQLALDIQRMDAFLICYDLHSPVRNGPNYHKILEYVSTGKIIVSNYVSVYSHMPQLIQMVSSPDKNAELPALFHHVITHLDEFNTQSLIRQRKDFAADNTYAKQVNRIEKLIDTHFSK